MEAKALNLASDLNTQTVHETETPGRPAAAQPLLLAGSGLVEVDQLADGREHLLLGLAEDAATHLQRLKVPAVSSLRNNSC
ncbi:MAG: hypothetical protein M0017_11475 [Desulfobacteraceae bacterium]|nr:hypothetical protein [Desulfobacteraceae bacterium]